MIDYRDKTFFGGAGNGDSPDRQENAMQEEEEEAHKIEIVEGALLDFEIPILKPLPEQEFALSRQDIAEE